MGDGHPARIGNLQHGAPDASTPANRAPLSGIAVTADGKRLLVGTGTDENDGHLTVFQLDPSNEPSKVNLAPGNWGKLEFDMPLGAIPEAIATAQAADQSQYAALTYRYRVSALSPWQTSTDFPKKLQTFSTVTFTTSGPVIKDVKTQVPGGNLDPFINDYYNGYYTNVLTPRDITLAPDLSYAYIGDWELFLVFGYGGQRGDKVGLVRNPFGLNGTPTYLGATTPIEDGLVTSVAVSSDGKRLFASYWGAGEVLVMDTAELIAAGESLAATPRQAERQPLDQVNPNVHITPLTGAGTWDLATQPVSSVKLLEPLNPIPAAQGEESDITFRWAVDTSSIGLQPVKSKLYVSVFREGMGLFPDDPSTLSGVLTSIRTAS